MGARCWWAGTSGVPYRLLVPPGSDVGAYWGTTCWRLRVLQLMEMFTGAGAGARAFTWRRTTGRQEAEISLKGRWSRLTAAVAALKLGEREVAWREEGV